MEAKCALVSKARWRSGRKDYFSTNQSSQLTARPENRRPHSLAISLLWLPGALIGKNFKKTLLSSISTPSTGSSLVGEHIPGTRVDAVLPVDLFYVPRERNLVLN